MGGTLSKNSLVKKNEIVNWTFEKASWLDVQFGLPDINLKGQVALRNQLESEKDLSLSKTKFSPFSDKVMPEIPPKS